MASVDAIGADSAAALAAHEAAFSLAGEALSTAAEAGFSGSASLLAEAAASAAQTAAQQFASGGSWQSVGANAAYGIAQGIYAGRSAVIAAAVSIATAAYQAAKSALAIRSPSKLMAEVGAYYDLGLAQGIQAYSAVVTDAASDLADDALQAAKQALSNYEVYNEASAETEMRYWATIAATITEGTQARTDADALYLKARKAYLAELELQNQAALEAEQAQLEAEQKRLAAEQTLYAGLRDAAAQYYEDVDEAMQTFREDYQQELSALEDSIGSEADLFTRFDSSYRYNAGTLISVLQSQLEGIETWSENLDKIAARDVGSDFVSMLESLGTDAAGEIGVIARMTDEQLETYVNLWREKNALVSEEAKTELEGLRSGSSELLDGLTDTLEQSVQAAYDSYLGTLSDLKADALETLGELPAEFEAIGGAMSDSLAEGISAGQQQVILAAVSSVEQAYQTAMAVLGSSSGSTSLSGISGLSVLTGLSGSGSGSAAAETTAGALTAVQLQALRSSASAAAARSQLTGLSGFSELSERSNPESGSGGAAGITVNQNIYSQKQTAADIYKETLWYARQAALKG